MLFDISWPFFEPPFVVELIENLRLRLWLVFEVSTVFEWSMREVRRVEPFMKAVAMHSPFANARIDAISFFSAFLLFSSSPASLMKSRADLPSLPVHSTTNAMFWLSG
jgi:hypothetical protein